MIKQALIGVVAVGSVGYFVADQAPEPNPEQNYQYPLVNQVMSASVPLSTAETKARAFAVELREFQSYTKSGTFDSQRILMHRDRIRSTFEGAYGEIEVLENEGELQKTDPARVVMQHAISEYMDSTTTEKSPPITRDLEAYSRFLTETFIARSLASAEMVH